jgi:hypothetical protein
LRTFSIGSRRQRHRQNGICPEFRLVGGCVEVEHHLIDRFLIGGRHAHHCRSDPVVDVLDGPQYAFPAVTGSAVPKLDGFERPR